MSHVCFECYENTHSFIKTFIFSMLQIKNSISKIVEYTQIYMAIVLCSTNVFVSRLILIFSVLK